MIHIDTARCELTHNDRMSSEFSNSLSYDHDCGSVQSGGSTNTRRRHQYIMQARRRASHNGGELAGTVASSNHYRVVEQSHANTVSSMNQHYGEVRRHSCSTSTRRKAKGSYSEDVAALAGHKTTDVNVLRLYPSADSSSGAMYGMHQQLPQAADLRNHHDNGSVESKASTIMPHGMTINASGLGSGEEHSNNNCIGLSMTGSLGMSVTTSLEEQSRGSASQHTSDSNSDIHNFTTLLEKMNVDGPSSIQSSSNFDESDIISCMKRGSILYEKGRYKEAIEAFKKALPLEMMRRGAQHKDVAEIHTTIGGIYGKMGRYDDALAQLEEALLIYRRHFDKFPLDVASILNVIGVAHKKRRDYPNSLSAFKECLRIRQKALGDFHVDVAMAWANVGSIYMYGDDYRNAISCYIKSLTASKAIASKAKSDLGSANKLRELAIHAYKKADYKFSEEALMEARDAIRKHLGSEHIDLIDIYELLYKVHLKTNDQNKATLRKDQASYIRQKNKAWTTDANIIVASLKDRRESGISGN